MTTAVSTDWIQAAQEAATTLGQHADSVDREARWPQESLQALRDKGLLGLTVPAEFGGAGQGPTVFAEVVRILAEQCASTAMIYLMHNCAVQVFVAAPDFQKRAEVLSEIAAGKHLSTLAFSEKGSRSHFWAPIGVAVPHDGGVRISAHKSFVTSAGHAHSFVTSVRSAGATDAVTSTLYYMPRTTLGVEIQAPWRGLGLRGNDSAAVDLADVKVADGDRVSADKEGFTCMLQVVLPWFQIGSAAVTVGIAQAATASTRNHLKASRLEHMGDSLADLPGLRARLARMQIVTDAQTALVKEVGRKMEAPQPDTLLKVLESKASAGEAVLEVTDLAMRACGGAAFRGDVGVERNFRDARACGVMAPTTDVLHDFIGKALLDMPLF